MTTQINEAAVEDAALSWFGDLGYAVVHGEQIAPGEASSDPCWQQPTGVKYTIGAPETWFFLTTVASPQSLTPFLQADQVDPREHQTCNPIGHRSDAFENPTGREPALRTQEPDEPKIT